MTETTTQNTSQATVTDARTEATVAWLQSEFPGWDVQVDQTDTGDQVLRPLWIASREGHHPQAELSAAKLHSRLSDYLAREEQRQAAMN